MFPLGLGAGPPADAVDYQEYSHGEEYCCHDEKEAVDADASGDAGTEVGAHHGRHRHEEEHDGVQFTTDAVPDEAEGSKE